MNIDQFFDEWGCLDKFNGDGGDSCAYTCTFYALEAMSGTYNDKASTKLNPIDEALEHFQPSPGIIIRHPDKDRDASDWDRGSRDQEIPYIIAAGLLRREHFVAYVKGSARRLWLFTTNTRQNGANKYTHGETIYGTTYDYSPKLPDFTGPEHWAAILRGFKAWYLFPVIWLFDLFTLFSAVSIYYQGWHYNEKRKQWRWKKDIVMNHNLRALYGIYRVWSPFCALALWINGQDNLTIRMKQHFGDFPNHIVWIGDTYKKTYETIKKKSLWKRFICYG